MSFKKNNPDLCTPHRPLDLVKKVVIIDGMIGGGKNLVCSIVSSLPNVEMWIHRPNIEQVCALHHLDHISLDATKTLINTWMSEEIYNLSISRNINFKPSDYSSVFHDSRPLRYFKRLFKNPLKAKESIEKEMPILNLMTHVNTSYAKPLFEAIGERLVYIRVTRHPMSTYMLKHNARWTQRWETNDRHGHIMYKTLDRNSKSINLPFDAKNIEKTYLDTNSINRAILLFDQWIRNGDNFIDKINKFTKATIFEIPYELFVFDPQTYIKKIALSLGVTPDYKTNKMMRRQGVPRISLDDAPKNKVYLNYGLEVPKKNFTLSENFAQGRAYAEETASPEALSILDKLARDYEERHGINK
jgi:hypothetical protein